MSEGETEEMREVEVEVGMSSVPPSYQSAPSFPLSGSQEVLDIVPVEEDGAARALSGSGGEGGGEGGDGETGGSFGMSKRHIVGVAVLMATVAIWVLSGELIQYIYQNVEFDQPFFLTYYSTALFSVYMVGFLFVPSWKCSEKQEKSVPEFVRDSLCPPRGNPNLPQLPAPTDGADGDSWVADDSANSANDGTPSCTVVEVEELGVRKEGNGEIVLTREKELTRIRLEPGSEGEDMKEEKPGEKATAWETAKVAVMFCPVWFLANWTYNLSLSHTSVASSTILASSSGLWTLILAAVIGAEKFSWIKLLAVILTLGGVVCVATTDAGGEGTELWGDVAAVASAVCYAVYVVMLKVKIKDESRMHNAMFFGFVGVINVLTLWPVGILLNVIGLDEFQMPTWDVIGFLTLNGLIGTVLSDYLWLLSVLLTSPLVATLGLSLTIPGSMIADAILHDESFSLLYVLGSLLVLVGFVVVNGDGLIRAAAARIVRAANRFFR